MDALLNRAAERAARYLAGLASERVAPSAEAVARLAELGGAWPEVGEDPGAVLALLDEIGLAGHGGLGGGRFFGFVIGGSLPAALAANWLAGAWDQNSGLRAISPTASALEEIALALAGRGAGVAAGLRRGLRDGRDDGELHRPGRGAARGAGAGRLGCRGRRTLRRAADHRRGRRGDAPHAASRRSGCWGCGRRRVVAVPIDERGADARRRLPRARRPDHRLRCRRATSTPGPATRSAVLCARAHAAGAWVHVDGAFGLWAAAAPGAGAPGGGRGATPTRGRLTRTSG